MVFQDIYSGNNLKKELNGREPERWKTSWKAAVIIQTQNAKELELGP